ncbi:unnamed protein product, partial [Aureobasidium vineae]
MAQCSLLHDVLIIGAGPCGLAVSARLCERTPSAIFTDTEHQRYHWIRNHGDRVFIKDKRTGQTKTPNRPESCRNYSTLVLDGTNKDWMARWNHLFKTFEISHLRSPLFFHVDPQDRDGLLSYTYEQGRDNELVEIPECVGKEISKHKKKQRLKCQTHGPPVTIDERDRKDYFTPSCSLFQDYCECVIDRYGLRNNLIQKERVEDIDFSIVPEVSETEQVFTVRSDQGTHHARSVILAVGPGNVPSIPAGLGRVEEGCCHAMQIREFPDPSVRAKLQQKKDVNIVVVGGGLTSAQLTVMASKHGARKVFHLLLKQYVTAGKIALHTETTIASSTFSNGSWSLTTSPPLNLPKIDYIYFATGIASDFRSLTFLETINRKFPVDSYGGLPALTDDLMWKENVPLFVTGRLAALRLGPGAGNLAGARSGAERIAWAIEDVLPREQDRKEDDDKIYNFKAGTGSQFCSLDCEACI